MRILKDRCHRTVSFYAGLLLNIGLCLTQAASIPDELEGPNLIGPLKTTKPPKRDWERFAPQGKEGEQHAIGQQSTSSKKQPLTLREYIDRHPELKEKILHNLPKKFSPSYFLEYDDFRD